MNRRELLHRGAVALAAWPALRASLLAQSEHPAWPGPIGLEMYTVRREYAKDPLGTLRKVAAIGYKEIEFGIGLGTGDTPANTMAAFLEQAGLSARSAMADFPVDPEKFKAAIDYGKKVGIDYIGVGYADGKTEDGWKKVAAVLNRAGRQAADAGLTYFYHAHMQEFRPVDKTTGYEILQKETDAKLVKFEADIFWMTWAKQDPIDWFQRYPGRFPLLHIKDRKKGITWDPRQFPGPGQQPFAEDGRGAIDWPRIFKAVDTAGAKHIFVEQDETDRTPIESATISYNYLKSLTI